MRVRQRWRVYARNWVETADASGGLRAVSSSYVDERGGPPGRGGVTALCTHTEPRAHDTVGSG